MCVLQQTCLWRFLRRQLRTDIIFKHMQPVLTYNILIIGRSGSGKSATTKLLTSNPAIKVGNSLRQVTKQVLFHEGTAFEVGSQFIRFCVLDIPGLDKLNNRPAIRESILQTLETRGVSLHAIVYVSSLTERDTHDGNKLFHFLQQLPWPGQLKKIALIPLLTKYDNLVIDSQEEDIDSTKKEYQEVFQKAGYGVAWKKHIFWINQTKSLDFKIKSYQQIRQTFQKQVERLLEMIRKNKNPLTAMAIREVIENEDRFILKRLFHYFSDKKLAYKSEPKSHQVVLKVQVEPHTVEQGLTAFSASSIGIFLSKVCQKEVSTSFSFILMSLPIAITLLKLASDSFSFSQKIIGQTSSGSAVLRSYEHICEQINRQMEKEWKELNDSLEFKVYSGRLYCLVHSTKPFKFFDLSNLQITYENINLDKQQGQITRFCLRLPSFKEDILWNAQLTVSYAIKRYSQQQILKMIEKLRMQFCAQI